MPHAIRTSRAKRSRVMEFRNREGEEEFVFSLPRRIRVPGTSAFVRARDEETKIEHCLRSILPAFDEIHVIDNGSRDATPDIVRTVQASAGEGEKIRLHSYPFRVARFGAAHDETPQDSVHSLVYFTNWALSRCGLGHACKWDADMVLDRERRGDLTRVLASLSRGWPAAWSLAGQTVYRLADGSLLAPRGEINREVRIAPVSHAVRFHKRPHWEQLIRPRWLRTHHLAPACFFELRFLDEDEFDHWSTADFPSPRKRREWATFTALREGRSDGAFRRLPPSFLSDQLPAEAPALTSRAQPSGTESPSRSKRRARHLASDRQAHPSPAITDKQHLLPVPRAGPRRYGLARTMPHFLGIGATRSGTSWVAAHLAAHPQIRMRRKEIHFFDRKLGSGQPLGSPGDRLDQLRYASRFLRPPHGHRRGARRRLRGEITPAYAVLEPAVIERIAAWMPDVKLVFMMRDPIERAWSQARNGFPRWRGRPLEDVGRDELIAFLESDPVRRRSDYATCIRNWMACFPAGQLFFGFLDEIKACPDVILRDLFGFLEVELDSPAGSGASLRRPVNASPPVPLPDWVRDRLQRTYAFDPTEVSDLIGRDVPWSASPHRIAVR